MESEATPTVEANFRPPETRGNFNVEAPADNGVMDINSQEYAEYKSGVEAADQAKLAEVRAKIAQYEKQRRLTAKIEEERRLTTVFTENGIETYKEAGGFFGSRPLENFEIENINGKDYFIEYVSKDYFVKNHSSKYRGGQHLYGLAYGVGTGNRAQVREDLPPIIRNFVKEHELYHLQDTKGGGTFMREVRADFYPALKDSAGFLATGIYGLFDTFRDLSSSSLKLLSRRFKTHL